MKLFKITKESILLFALAACYLTGIILLFSFFKPLINDSLSAKEHYRYLITNKISLQFWYLVIYVVFGILLIPLTNLLKHQFKKSLGKEIIAIFGYIWAAFVLASGFIFIVCIENISKLPLDEINKINIWYTVELIQNALGGGTELLGGIWVFVIGLTSIQQQKFSKFLNYFSLVLGFIGIVSIVPNLMNIGGVFGILQIVWFIILGFTFCKS